MSKIEEVNEMCDTCNVVHHWADECPEGNQPKQTSLLHSEDGDMKLPTVEDAGKIALGLISADMTDSDTAFFIAGFQECIKYLTSQHSPIVKDEVCE